jgi:hypothetical protein
MSDSLARRKRRLQEEVGDNGKAKAWIGKQGQGVYQVSCRLCGGGWNSFRAGQENGLNDATSRWEVHLQSHQLESPPATDAPHDQVGKWLGYQSGYQWGRQARGAL